VKIEISSGQFRRTYTAPSGHDAVRKFFDEIRAGKIDLGDLGLIGEWADAKEAYPFRIVPALCKAGFITWSQMENLHKLAGANFTQAELTEMVNTDSWMVRTSADVEEITTVQ
jgi:hypothetical protein